MGFLTAGRFIKLSFKTLKFMSSCSSHKLGWGCFPLVKQTYKGLAIKGYLEYNFDSNQPAQENVTVGTSFWVLRNLGHQKVYLDLGVNHDLIPVALNIKPGFGQTATLLW